MRLTYIIKYSVTDLLNDNTVANILFDREMDKAHSAISVRSTIHLCFPTIFTRM